MNKNKLTPKEIKKAILMISFILIEYIICFKIIAMITDYCLLNNPVNTIYCIFCGIFVLGQAMVLLVWVIVNKIAPIK